MSALCELFKDTRQEAPKCFADAFQTHLRSLGAMCCICNVLTKVAAQNDPSICIKVEKSALRTVLQTPLNTIGTVGGWEVGEGSGP